MKLYVVRHGYAGDFSLDPKKERERSLTKDAVRTVEAMAEAFVDLDDPPLSIFTSPFIRAQETADILGKAWGVQVNVIGDMAPVRPLVPAIETLIQSDLRRVMIVGHVDNTTPAFQDEMPSDDIWVPLVMAEIRAVKVERSTLKWALRWTLKPSDLGFDDVKKAKGAPV